MVFSGRLSYDICESGKNGTLHIRIDLPNHFTALLYPLF